MVSACHWQGPSDLQPIYLNQSRAPGRWEASCTILWRRCFYAGDSVMLLGITPDWQSSSFNGKECENFMKLVLWVQLAVSLEACSVSFDCLATVAGIAWTWSGHLMILAVSDLPIIAHRIEGKTLWVVNAHCFEVQICICCWITSKRVVHLLKKMTHPRPFSQIVSSWLLRWLLWMVVSCVPNAKALTETENRSVNAP